MQQQAQMQEQMKQGMQKLEKLEQENQMLKMKAAADVDKIQIEKYKAETARLEAYASILKDDEALNLQQLEGSADRALQMVGHIRDSAESQMERDHQAAQADKAAEAAARNASSPAKDSTQPSE
jgi:hypothetical protein